MGEWRSMDTAPKDGTEFLAFWSYSTGIFKYIQPMKWVDERFVISWDHDDEINPTHWMPLPKPPEEQQ